MTCIYCGTAATPGTDTEHYAACKKAPEFVAYQARAEIRAEAGGPLAPDRPFTAGGDPRNRIDRGE